MPLQLTFDSSFKILKSSRIFLVKSTSECYFRLADKVCADSNKYFLVIFGNSHSKSLELLLARKITFRLLQLTFDSDFKIFECFRNFLVKMHQNATSDLQTKFLLIATSAF